MTAFVNGSSVDWKQNDPFNAYVATRKEWNLLRHSKAHVELCAFAAKPPYFSRSTRDALQRALELLVENPGDVSVSFPKKHTVYPYLARTAEAKGPKTARMLRLRPGWDCAGAVA